MSSGIGKNLPGIDVDRGDGCTHHIPTSSEYLASLRTIWLIAFGFMGLLTCIVVAVYIDQMIYFFRRKKAWSLREKAKWVLLIYPMMAIPAFVALCVPRSAYLGYLVTSVYVSLCLYIFITMLIGHFGGATDMAENLADRDVEIRINTTPLCCCFVCLPKLPVTRQRLRLLKFMVLQFAHIRPVVGYILAVIYADRHYGELVVGRTPNTYLDTLNTVSSLIASWGLKMTFVMAKAPLDHRHITAKFRCMTMIILIEGVQQGVVNFFVYTGVITCDGLLSAQSNADRWNCIVCIIEAFILSMVARHYYRLSQEEEEAGKPPPATGVQGMTPNSAVPLLLSQSQEQSYHPLSTMKQQSHPDTVYLEGAEITADHAHVTKLKPMRRGSEDRMMGHDQEEVLAGYAKVRGDGTDDMQGVVTLQHNPVSSDV